MLPKNEAKIASKHAVKDFPEVGVKKGDLLHVYRIYPDPEKEGEFIYRVGCAYHETGKMFYVPEYVFDWCLPDFEKESYRAQDGKEITRGEMVSLVLRMREAGATWDEIARVFDRSKGAIQYMVKMDAVSRGRTERMNNAHC